MMKRRGSLLCGVVIALAVGGVFAAQATVAADRVLTNISFDQTPLVVADAPAQRMVVFTDAGQGGWSMNGGAGGAAMAQVLDDNGQLISAVPVGPRPSQALVDPRTGHIFLLTTGVPGAAETFFSSSGTYLSTLDPTHALVLHTSIVHQAPPPGGAFGGGRPFFGGRPPFGAGSRPPPWLRTYQSVTALNGQGIMALDSERRRLFVATGGGGGGFAGGRGIINAGGPAQLTVLNADTSAVIRTLSLPVGVAAMAVDPVTARLFMVDRTGTLRILDVRTLQPVRSLRVGGSSAFLAVDSGARRAYVLDAAAGRVTTLDSKSGAVLATATVVAGATGIQVDERAGHVFVESAGAAGFGLTRAGPGTVSMLDAGTGRLLRTVQVGPLPFGAAVDAAHHRLFVGSFDAADTPGPGRVQVLDTASGALLRSIMVSTNPFSLSVNPQDERLAVSGIDSGPLPSNGWTGAVDRTRQVFGPSGPAATSAPVQPQGGMDAAGAMTVVQAAR